jgi:hypothetical protein
MTAICLSQHFSDGVPADIYRHLLVRSTIANNLSTMSLNWHPPFEIPPTKNPGTVSGALLTKWRCLRSGGRDSSGAVLRPAISHEAEADKASDQHRPSRWQRGGSYAHRAGVVCIDVISSDEEPVGSR